MEISRIAVLLVCLIASFQNVIGDTMTVSVQFSGSTCTICGVTNFDPISAGSSGFATFTDPLPANAVLNQIEVSTTAMYWCGSDVPLSFSTNYVYTANVTGEYDCVCGQCPTVSMGMSAFYSSGFPSYRYGSSNTLSVYNNDFSGSVGVAVITLTLTYNSGGGQYTNTSVMVPYTGCGYCDLCGSDSYSLSNMATDCGEGLWDEGFRWFQDPVPMGSKVVQITVATTSVFWCESPSMANFTVDGTLIGNSNPVEHAECQCNSCPGPQMIASKMFTSGFPGYMYGQSNSLQVGAMQGVIGVGQLELIITYQSMSSSTAGLVIN